MVPAVIKAVALKLGLIQYGRTTEDGSGPRWTEINARLDRLRMSPEPVGCLKRNLRAFLEAAAAPASAG